MYMFTEIPFTNPYFNFPVSFTNRNCNNDIHDLTEGLTSMVKCEDGRQIVSRSNICFNNKGTNHHSNLGSSSQFSTS